MTPTDRDRGRDLDALLEALTAVPGLSGHESDMADCLTEQLGPLVDSHWRDPMGNWLGRRAPRPAPATGAAPAPRLLLSAHMDAIGFMVTAVEDGGFLRFTGLGGWDPRLLLAQPVTVLGARPLPGVVGSRPPHVLGPELSGKVLPPDELFIDVGLPEVEVRAAVRVGDVIAPRRPLQRLQGRRRAGRALDNRASLAALILAMDLLARREHQAEILLLATVQEEVGLRGARPGVWELEADAAVVLDVTFAVQTGVSDVPGSLGGGPLIGVGPNMHPVIERRLRQLAAAAELKHGREPLAGPSGTDAWAFQVAAAGLPRGLLSVPIRYMHSRVESVDLADNERAGRLLAEFAAAFDAALVDDLVGELHGVTED